MRSLRFLNPLRPIISRLEKIMSDQAQLATDLTAVTQQIAKIGTETAATLQKVTDLEAALNAGGAVTPEVQAAFDALKAQVQVVDDLVPDAQQA
jgi:chromosome segregation ATPase